MIPKFEAKELEILGSVPDRMGGAPSPIYNFPVSMREGVKAIYDRKPIWQTTNVEGIIFNPSVIPDNVARAYVIEAEKFPIEKVGGLDMFGMDWEYIPSVGGSMIRPGKAFLSDANEWYDKVKFPDIEKWDWEGCYKLNKGFLKTDRHNVTWLFTGWFERLISWLDFEAAILSMVDEDQEDAVKDLFMKLSELYIKIANKLISYYPEITSFLVHDDWGSQKETFFSPSIVAEFIVPAMKKFTDHIHSTGRICELHSCGQIFKQVPNMIAAGWDSWIPQPMNDTKKIYELYGDKILVSVVPDNVSPSMSEKELRASARTFVENYCDAKKPCFINLRNMPDAFREELYKASREKFSK
jgi:hypothetical protein